MLTVVVSQEMEYGAEVSSTPRFAAPSRNWTPATPTSSEAPAVTETVPLTVAPAAGAVIETAGGWSAGTTAVTCADAPLMLPAASSAVTR